MRGVKLGWDQYEVERTREIRAQVLLHPPPLSSPSSAHTLCPSFSSSDSRLPPTTRRPSFFLALFPLLFATTVPRLSPLAVAAARAHPFARLFSTSCPVSKPHLILHARIVDNIGGGLHSAADPGAGNINPLRFVPHSNRIGFSRESSLFFFLSRLFRTCFEECGLYRLLCIAGIMYVCMYVCSYVFGFFLFQRLYLQLRVYCLEN